jgi:hypothetical protein
LAKASLAALRASRKPRAHATKAPMSRAAL